MGAVLSAPNQNGLKPGSSHALSKEKGQKRGSHKDAPQQNQDLTDVQTQAAQNQLPQSHDDYESGNTMGHHSDHVQTNLHGSGNHKHHSQQNNNNYDHSNQRQAFYGETAREVGVAYLIVTALVSFVLGGLISVGLYIYCRHYRKQRRQDEALWSTSFTSAGGNSENMFAANGPFFESSPSTNSHAFVASSSANPLPKMNNVDASFEMAGRVHNNLNELSYSDKFGSLRKGKLTVNEAETMKRNSMWTDFSMKDDNL